MGKKVAILQSNYIPWKGYFDIIGMVDEFILYDDAQFTKNDWRNRNKVKSPKGPTWLTIPIKTSGRSTQLIRETVVDGQLWRAKHWKAINLYYAKADFFHEYKEIFASVYRDNTETLSTINFQFINAICQILGIETKISWSMEYHLEGHRVDRLISLCQQTGATEYLSGPSAQEYIDPLAFGSADIKLSYMDYNGYLEYGQLFPPFVHDVSVIDLIFNEGPNARKFMKSPRK